jgi:hypothetical protein
MGACFATDGGTDYSEWIQCVELAGTRTRTEIRTLHYITLHYITGTTYQTESGIGEENRTGKEMKGYIVCVIVWYSYSVLKLGDYRLWVMDG